MGMIWEVHTDYRRVAEKAHGHCTACTVFRFSVSPAMFTPGLSSSNVSDRLQVMSPSINCLPESGDCEALKVHSAFKF